MLGVIHRITPLLFNDESKEKLVFLSEFLLNKSKAVKRPEHKIWSRLDFHYYALLHSVISAPLRETEKSARKLLSAQATKHLSQKPTAQ